MIYFYSPSTGCFYTPDIHGSRTLLILDPAWTRPLQTITLQPGELATVIALDGVEAIVSNTGNTPMTVDNALDYSAEHPSIEIENPNCLIPADAVEITAERHDELLSGQAAGQQIVPGEDGAPVLISPIPVVVIPSRVETYAAINWLIARKDSEGVSLWTKIKAAANAMPEGDDKEMMLNGINRAKYWLRADPLVEAMRQIIGMTTEELDAAFIEINAQA